MRDYFRSRHRELTTSKSGFAPSKKRKWALHDSMTFLVQFMADRPTCTNLGDEDTDSHSISNNDNSQGAGQSFDFSYGSPPPGTSTTSAAQTDALSQASGSSFKRKTKGEDRTCVDT
ncbi:hypothetical protein RRG08_049837 [Elysia crispata]|uniref:Uncharacterized protein n=1 Tax=Elysia crispata TaxID=231223 RepID=A0AAE0ZUI7_9GAST|nr:hypothetical protein RRG08_049837 [Elysia crispata]